MRRNDPRLGRLRSSFTFPENDERPRLTAGPFPMCIVMLVPMTGEPMLSILTASARCAGRVLLASEMPRLFLDECLSEAAEG